MKFHLVATVCLLAYVTIQAKETTRPNILFIMSDDHAAAAWGIYPSILQEYVHAPHIQRLADEGVRLDRAYATNSLCGPSRASILTGQYSHLNGVRTNADVLDPTKETVPLWLKKAGYQTALIGKWHLKSKPSWFDFYTVLPGQGIYQNPILRTAENWDAGGVPSKGFSTDVITTQALDWLENRNAAQPFFMMCHYKAPHEPFGYPERHAKWLEDVEFPIPENLQATPEKSGRTFSGQTLDILAERFKRKPARYQLEKFHTASEPESLRVQTYQQLLKNFLRSVRAIDENIGRLLNYLEQTGELDNTVIIYTTDQGYFLGEHGFFDKRIMYEEAIRMPMVLRYPKEIPAGTHNTDFILNVDLPLLFLDYAGLPAPQNRHGRSFRANLMGRTPDDWRTAFYYRYWTHQKNRPAHVGVRTQSYKLIHFYGLPLGLTGTFPEPTPESWELYDLNTDPTEGVNRYNDPAYRIVREELIIELNRLRRKVGDRIQVVEM
jgi:arylsulfatase A-like enzyme